MKRRIVNPWAWQEPLGYQQAHEVTGAERTLYLAGQVSVDTHGRLVHDGDMAAQIRQVIDNIETVLGAAEMGLADIVRLTKFTTDLDLFLDHERELSRLNAAGARYTSTLVEVTRLAHPGFLVELEATAVA